MTAQNFKLYNAHPEGKLVNDCVKRAITLVAQMDYKEVQLELNRYKKISGAKVFNERKNCGAYCEKVLHMTKLSFPAVVGEVRMNGDRFTKSYPKGRYILNMAGHWSACVDGVIYDTWDCRDKCVYTAYQWNDSDTVAKIKQAQDKEKKSKEQQKLAIKKIKDKYSNKMKPLQKKLKELEKMMAKELEALKG